MTDKVLINVGCALSIGNSWQNFDASPILRFEKFPVIGKLYQKNKQRFPETVKFGDITKSLLCNQAEADAVFCSHMLEHVGSLLARSYERRVRATRKTALFT